MKRNQLPIGVFDSGIGGLTVVKQLRRVMPHEDLVYLGDTARVPYGTKSPETVVRFACEDTRFLLDRPVKSVVVACNSASAWALNELERRFDVPVFGVIVPGAEAALKRSRTLRIGVIGTRATVRSDAYRLAIRKSVPGARVISRPCPLLVPMVEEGWTRGDVTRRVLHEYLDPLLKQSIDTLILGCTHYPLLKTAIREVVGTGIPLVDSAVSCAKYVAGRLEKMDLLAEGRRRSGVIFPFVTDEASRFAEFSKRFLGAPTKKAIRVELPTG